MLTACFAITVLSYSACGVLLARGWHGHRTGLLLLAAVGGTWLWAAIGLIDTHIAGRLAGILEIVNGLRAALWVWLVYGVLGLVRRGEVAVADWKGPLLRVGAGISILKLALALLALARHEAALIAQLDRAAGLALAIFGLVLVENVYAASDRGARWAIKHLLIAAGFLFALDMFRYADALLVRQFSDVSLLAQALLTAMTAPLLVVAAARIRQFAIVVHVARRFVLQTSALLFSGIYLLIVALAGFFLRRLDMTWGPALQIASLLGALILLALLLSSGQARAHGRRLVERSFFNFAYDYREEWLRFVATMAAGEAGSTGLYERAVRAVAEPLDCSAGLLFLRDRQGGYRRASAWNWMAAGDRALPHTTAIAALETGSKAVIDLRREPQAWPDGPEDTWLLLGLRSHGRCLGLLALGRPRVQRGLTWEDHDLLAIFATEIGSYLAEEQALCALLEAQRFASIAKSFSFVAHDLKNVVTQLSLLLQQAKHHGDKPEFVRDTLLTVSDSVDKMRATLLRLREDPLEHGPVPVELNGLLEKIAGSHRPVRDNLHLSLPPDLITTTADAEALSGIISNLVDNALESGAEDVAVEIALTTSEDWAIIEVRDDGPGMSRELLDSVLSRPFSSAKPTGFGIGLYQCREWVERWGGHLDVTSTPGLGTLATLRLPLPTSLPAGSRSTLPQPAAMARA